jgi:hypothetical protein
MLAMLQDSMLCPPAEPSLTAGPANPGYPLLSEARVTGYCIPPEAIYHHHHHNQDGDMVLQDYSDPEDGTPLMDDQHSENAGGAVPQYLSSSSSESMGLSMLPDSPLLGSNGAESQDLDYSKDLLWSAMAMLNQDAMAALSLDPAAPYHPPPEIGQPPSQHTRVHNNPEQSHAAAETSQSQSHQALHIVPDCPATSQPKPADQGQTLRPAPQVAQAQDPTDQQPSIATAGTTETSGQCQQCPQPSGLAHKRPRNRPPVPARGFLTWTYSRVKPARDHSRQPETYHHTWHATLEYQGCAIDHLRLQALHADRVYHVHYRLGRLASYHITDGPIRVYHRMPLQ